MYLIQFLLGRNKGNKVSITGLHRHRIILLCIGAFFLTAHKLSGQELEPRNLTNVPVGKNFMVFGYGHTRGNILLDPSFPIEGLNANLNLMVGGYVRSINFFGMSGKVDVMLPYGFGDWTGNYEGVDTATSRVGFGDPSVRLSVNFIGAPALNPLEYKGYKQKTIVGAAIRIRAPLGQYNSSKLINLGSNRWTFIFKAGVSHYVKKWIFEAYAGAWFFTKNENFFGGNELKQKPFFTGTLHVIRILPHNMWLAADGGYGIGSRVSVNDELRDTRLSTFRFGLTYAISVLQQHTFKLTVYSARRLEKGPDFDSVVLAYSFRWNKSGK